MHYFVTKLPEGIRPVEPKLGSVGLFLSRSESTIRLRFFFPFTDQDGTDFTIAHCPDKPWFDLDYAEDLLSPVQDGVMVRLVGNTKWSYCENTKLYTNNYNGDCVSKEPYGFVEPLEPSLFSGNHVKLLRLGVTVKVEGAEGVICCKTYDTESEAREEWELLSEMETLRLCKDLRNMGFQG